MSIIFHNYIANKYILHQDEGSSWINEEIKSLIQSKSSHYRRQTKSSNNVYTLLYALMLDKWNAIGSSKSKHHEQLANKFNDPKIVPKTYRTILKIFVNGSKVSLIPPLPVNGKLVTSLLEKANLLNNFFTTISNSSTVPVSINFKTFERLPSLKFCVDHTVKIIQSLVD